MHYFNLSLLDVYKIRSKCREIGEATLEVKCYRMIMIMMLDIDSKCKLDEGGSGLRYYTSWIICLSFPSLRRAVFMTWVFVEFASFVSSYHNPRNEYGWFLICHYTVIYTDRRDLCDDYPRILELSLFVFKQI